MVLGKVLGEINFPDYENFDNVNDTYSNFIQNLDSLINHLDVYMVLLQKII